MGLIVLFHGSRRKLLKDFSIFSVSPLKVRLMTIFRSSTVGVFYVISLRDNLVNRYSYHFIVSSVFLLHLVLVLSFVRMLPEIWCKVFLLDTFSYLIFL